MFTTNSTLAQFQFESNQVRVILIEDEPWFVAQDVAQVLEYANPAMALVHADEEDKQTVNPQKLDSLISRESFGSNTFRVSLLNESGLYAVIFGSTKPQAKVFKKWVTSEVLPSIRKTGSYTAKPKCEIELLIESAQQLLKVKQEQERLKLEQQIQAQEILELKQLAQQHDAELDRVFNPYGHYFTVLGYSRIKGLTSIPVKEASKIGVKCSAHCKRNNIPIQKVNDPRFGMVNSYPSTVIDTYL